MKFLVLLLFSFFYISCCAQKADTLTFYSEAFKENRTIYVQTPEFFKYKSESVKLPVFYILDGQQEWLVKPLLSTVRYLEYTHEIPQAIVVVVPLKDRNKECGLRDLNGPAMPLHTFITEEVAAKVKRYDPNGYNLLVGHSFSASFALYSLLKSPTFYSAVMANTPMDHLEDLVVHLTESPNIDKKSIFISVGGAAPSKDFYHRTAYEQVKAKHPFFFQDINTYEADASAHNAVPLVAMPIFLSELFLPFSTRFTDIAKVNDEYKIVTPPKSLADEMTQVRKKEMLGDKPYLAEVADINGLASRYNSSGYTDYAVAMYEMGVENFPLYYEFHRALGELYMESNKEKAKQHIDRAIKLLKTVDRKMEDQKEILEEVRSLRGKLVK